MIILNSGDHVLRKIKHCETSAFMWSTLDRFYLSKNLPNRIFVQSQFYTFKSDVSKSVDVNVDDFLKIVVEMSCMNLNVTDEIQAIVFLRSLLESYDQPKHSLKYGKYYLGLEKVMSAAKAREKKFSESSKLEKGSSTVLEINERGKSSRDSNDSRGRKVVGLSRDQR